MDEPKFRMFRSFPNTELAMEMADLLKKEGIQVKLKDNSPAVDITFTGNPLDDLILLKIPESDFEKAQEILESQAEIKLEEVSSDYYLLEFSNEELYDILANRDDWGEFDYLLAKKVLQSRNVNIDYDRISEEKIKKLEKQANPEPVQMTWIIVGYLMALGGGLLGLMIGWFLWQMKKTLPDGRKIHIYSQNSRMHGRNIFILGILVLAFVLIWFPAVYNNF